MVDAEYYQNHKEQCKGYTKKWTAKNPKRAYALRKDWRVKNLEKNNAGFAARRSQIPLKDHCEKCGAKDVKLERHHPDYSKPLEFLTLCRTCHKRLHIELKAKGLKIKSGFVGSGHCIDCNQHWPECGRGAPSLKGRRCVRFSFDAKNTSEHTVNRCSTVNP